MLGSAILVASAISVPSFPPATGRQVYDINHIYPSWAVREGKSAAAVLDLLVEPDGTIRQCTVVSFVGDERLAREVCEAHQGLRMVPAKGPDGEPILANYRTFLTLHVEDSPQRREVRQARQTPDLILEVASLEDGSSETFELELELLVDASGSVTACEAGADFETTRYAPYVEAACLEVMKITATPLAGSSGTTTDYVANMKVRFERNPST